MDGKRVWGAWVVFAVAASTSLDPSAVRRVLSPGPRAAPPAATRPEVSRVPRDYIDCPLCFLSSAAPDSLELLPGIGPVLAARVVEARETHGPFTSWDDLRSRVAGIGEKSAARLKREAEVFTPVITDRPPAAE